MAKPNPDGSRRARRGPRWAAIAALLPTGCSFVSTRVQPYLGGPTYPPSDPAKIVVLRVEPTRPHERLAWP